MKLLSPTKPRVLLLIFGLLALGSQCQAANVSFSDDWPAGSFLETPDFAEESNPNSTQWRYTSGGNRWVGFGFTAPEDTSLSSFTMTVYKENVSTAALDKSFTIYIVAMGEPNPDTSRVAPEIPLNVLYSETATTPASYGAEQYIEFNFETPYALTQGTEYGILLAFNESTGGGGINLASATSSSYSTGNIGWGFWTIDGGNSYASVSNVYAFNLQTVPEPSTWGAIGAGFVGLALLVRRRFSKRK